MLPPDFVKPTFDSFLSELELKTAYMDACTVSVLNFEELSPGSGISEKFEDIYRHLVEINDVLICKGARGYFWIAMSPNVYSFFNVFGERSIKVAPEIKIPEEDFLDGQIPQGLNNVVYKWLLNSRWRLYSVMGFVSNTLLMGCNDKVEDERNYARIVLDNFSL